MSAASTGSTGSNGPAPAGQAVRGDIQGLRAVAVLIVVVDHAGLGLPGGYVGVDVFFVISGYLISAQLFREAERGPRISVLGFYARRARRILPAATLVTVAVVVAALLLLSKVQADQVARDGIYATFFSANVHFAGRQVDYFAQGQSPSPLLHYWSLSVEEQFYLVWPLVLLGLLVLAGRARRPSGATGSHLPRRVVTVALCLLVLGSLTWSIVHTAHDPQQAYFSTTARGWELGLGALVALLGPALMTHATALLRSLLAVGGLLAIALACVLLDDRTPVPGSAALLPVLGGVAVVASGIGGARTAVDPWGSRLLSWQPLRRIGDWSYSLYLWHWPLLLLPQLRAGHELTAVTRLVLVAAAVALAGATYRWVETPFRTRRRSSWGSVALYPVAVAVVLVVSFGSIAVLRAELDRGDHPPVSLTDFGVDDESSYDLLPDPRQALVQASVIAARHHMAVPSHLTPDLLDLRSDNVDLGDCDYSTGTRRLCPLGDPQGRRTIVVLGDSHGRMWLPALEQVATASHTRLYALVRSRCSPSPIPMVDPTTDAADPECTDFNAWARQEVEALSPDLVVVASSPPHLTGGLEVEGRPVTDLPQVQAAWRTSFTELFTDLSAGSRRVVLLADAPAGPEDPAECLTTGSPDLGDCAFQPLQGSRRFRDITVEAARRLGVGVVDPTPWLCWDGTCPAVVGRTVTYRDAGHLSATYAGELAPELARGLGLPG